MSPARPPEGANSLSEGQGRRSKGAPMSAKGEGPRLRGSTSASAACDRRLNPQLHDKLPEVAA